MSLASQHLRLTWETNGKYVTSIENLTVSHLSNKCQGSTCLEKSLSSARQIYISTHSVKLITMYVTAHAMPMITWAKKSPSKSIYIGPKVHIVATWGTIKKFDISPPWRGHIHFKPDSLEFNLFPRYY